MHSWGSKLVAACIPQRRNSSQHLQRGVLWGKIQRRWCPWNRNEDVVVVVCIIGLPHKDLFHLHNVKHTFIYAMRQNTHCCVILWIVWLHARDWNKVFHDWHDKSECYFHSNEYDTYPTKRGHLSKGKCAYNVLKLVVKVHVCFQICCCLFYSSFLSHPHSRTCHLPLTLRSERLSLCIKYSLRTPHELPEIAFLK